MTTERKCRECAQSFAASNRSAVCGKCRYRKDRAGSALQSKLLHRARKERAASRPRPDRCECCGAKASDENFKVLHWDHNHGTGGFRGWACQGCNKALGYAGDNPAILRALAAYLETNGCSPTRPMIR